MKLYAQQVLLANGWATDKTLVIDKGLITAVEDGRAIDADIADGAVIPGMVNCHSHAFQRAFAGFCERGSQEQDSFWTWRKTMYQFLAQLSAEDAQTIAIQLYIEMLKSGYTRVAEFHYLHHDQHGNAYPELATMANAIFKAAQSTGIGLTLLPVLYCYSGFGAQPSTQGQRRFINSPQQFNQLVSECFQLSKDYPNTNVGIAPHSLRAVDKPGLEQAVLHLRQLNTTAPIHIHIAEQTQEVLECEQHYGKRPVQWLLDNLNVDQHWCLIHATHINQQERRSIVSAGAVAGICPTTEANLGDGIFPTTEFLTEQGTLAIGSDSHISVNPIEELRWLEYAQRLIKEQRTLLNQPKQPSTGLNLWQLAAQGGAQSTNSNTGVLAAGKQADLLVLDPTNTALFAQSPSTLMDSVIFASQQSPVKDVMVNGTWQIKNRKHALEQDANAAFAGLLARF